MFLTPHPCDRFGQHLALLMYFKVAKQKPHTIVGTMQLISKSVCLEQISQKYGDIYCRYKISKQLVVPVHVERVVVVGGAGRGWEGLRSGWEGWVVGFTLEIKTGDVMDRMCESAEGEITTSA